MEWSLMDTLFFFIHMSLDQPSPHEFTKYIGQPSAAPRLTAKLRAPRTLLPFLQTHNL